MPRRKMTIEEAWILLADAAKEGSRVHDPLKVLAAKGCGRATAVALICELAQRKALLPHCANANWNSVFAVTIQEQPPQKVRERVAPKPVPRPSQPQSDSQGTSRYSVPISRTILLVDYDNVMIALRKSVHRHFPFENVLRFAARYGGLEAAFVFCPLGADEKELLLFRQHGFQIVLAQSAKHGQDRVDKSLEDVGRLLLKNPDVGTVAILSEDRDFSDLFTFAVGNGKRVFQFRVDQRDKVFRSTDYQGEVIEIPDGPRGMPQLTTRPKTAWRAAAARRP